MNWKSWRFSKVVKRLHFVRLVLRAKKITMKRRRESVASVYKRTTKFLSSNTAVLLSKMPNNKKYRLLAKIMEECDQLSGNKVNENYEHVSEDEDDLGERELDYYMGVRKKEVYWRDPEAKEQIRRDFLVYHCGITEDDYNQNYKNTNTVNVPHISQPKLKQVPFKIHKKKTRKDIQSKEDSWREKTGIFKLFANRRDSEFSTSDSYSEYDTDDEAKDTDNKDNISDTGNERSDVVRDMTEQFNYLNVYNNRALEDMISLEVRIVIKLNSLIKIIVCAITTYKNFFFFPGCPNQRSFGREAVRQLPGAMSWIHSAFLEVRLTIIRLQMFI
jgi:hypothetical protein